LQGFQALQDSQQVAAAAINNINQAGINPDEAQLISKILHGTLALTPESRRTLEMVNQDLEDEGYGHSSTQLLC